MTTLCHVLKSISTLKSYILFAYEYAASNYILQDFFISLLIALYVFTHVYGTLKAMISLNPFYARIPQTVLLDTSDQKTGFNKF